MELSGVCVAFATVHFAEIAFTTMGNGFAELAVLKAFAMLAAVSGAVVARELRGILHGLVVAIPMRDAAPDFAAVTEGATCVAVFPSGPNAFGFEFVVLPHDSFVALLPSTPLSSEDVSSSYWISLSNSGRR